MANERGLSRSRACKHLHSDSISSEPDGHKFQINAHTNLFLLGRSAINKSLLVLKL